MFQAITEAFWVALGRLLGVSTGCIAGRCEPLLPRLQAELKLNKCG